MVTTSIKISNLNGSNGFRLDGVAGDKAGIAVSNAGDMNGDGFDDLIIGAPSANNASTYPGYDDAGSSYVVFGKAAGFSARLDLSNLKGDDGFRIDGVYSSRSGQAVSSAGDVNGDGFDDVIIGSPYEMYYQEGACYVIFGKPAGFSATLDLTSIESLFPGATPDDYTNGFRIEGRRNNYLGREISNAGDINGDGFDDLILSEFRDFFYYAGNKFVVFGKAEGFPDHERINLLPNGEFIHPGGSVSNAGDVNGDGFDDVIVGFSGGFIFDGHSYEAFEGGSYVVFGKATGLSDIYLPRVDGNNGFFLADSGSTASNAGDFNGDGFDDVIVGDRVVFGKASFGARMDISNLDGSAGFRLLGATEGLIETAGDVNGDGFDDLIIGSPSGDEYGSGNAGINYLLFGKAAGFTPTLNLSNIAESEGFRLVGLTTDDNLGVAVSSAGDVNNDGFDDLIIGAPGPRFIDSDSGSGYVIFGRSGFTSEADYPGTPRKDHFTGTPAAEIFDTGGGNDRMIGRGGADAYFGGAGKDYIRIADTNFLIVDGGTGSDTLGLAGSGFNLDLSSVINKIHGIETISLYGVGDNTLTLTASDVINLSDETNTLKIRGNIGDSVAGLNSDWTNGGVSGNFHMFTQGEAIVLIGVNVMTDFV
ncbi:MAG: FG-GAP repeat protein [Nitrosomonas sp.]|nr:FG-GAP repeat protein [Nitrosomonas sp.]